MIGEKKSILHIKLKKNTSNVYPLMFIDQLNACYTYYTYAKQVCYSWF